MPPHLANRLLFILFHGHSIKLSSKFVALYPMTTQLSDLIGDVSFFTWMAVNPEFYNWSQYGKEGLVREGGLVEGLHQMDHLYHHTPSLRLGVSSEKGPKKW